ncbi:phospholipid carrier-dependent glycosyltransferase [Candidatus Daviesbacteria bacterium]|nr:phospholipid carrier-dependent glycosyltransferase [Candidatus Daviesbacteria bacterium]
MLKKFNKITLALILILIFSLFSRIYRLDYPKNYVFDEVYNAFTTIEFTKGSKEAYEWKSTSPIAGTAYGWTHPPLAKLIDAMGILVFGVNSFGWRVVNVGLGVGIIFLIYLIARSLFPDKKTIALVASFIASLDGLLLVQSRINMNDIVIVFFILVSFLAFIKYKTGPPEEKNVRLLILSICLGLTIATKWTGAYLLIAIGFWIGLEKINHDIKEFKKLSLFLVIKDFIILSSIFIFIPFIIYTFTYTQYFLLGGSWNNFLELQKQMWWYNTNLKATHDYGSPWWSWPFNLYPVWYFVDYQKDKIANIFASGNPLVFWTGVLAIILTIFDFLKTRSRNLFIILLGYFIFWLPWALSPRVMFLYHYSPSIPFLVLALGYQVDKIKDKSFVMALLILMFLSFLLFFPFFTGIPLPKNLVQLFFLTNLTKNPFI